MKIKLTQSELKRQRDALRQYERYLPTLQLKKQQLQREISHQQGILEMRTRTFQEKREAAAVWSGLLVEFPPIRDWLQPVSMESTRTNIAGVDLRIFGGVTFRPADYDLFLTPLWVDTALDRLQDLVSLQEEMRILKEGISTLRHELLVTTQRVNLFEKVKIPETREAIRRIKIHLGDQMTNAVGRGKMVKRKIERANAEGGTT